MISLFIRGVSNTVSARLAQYLEETFIYLISLERKSVPFLVETFAVQAQRC